MSTITRPARTLMAACGALSVLPATAEAQAPTQPMTTATALTTVPAQSPTVPSPLTTEGLEHLIDQVRTQVRREARARANRGPARRLRLTDDGRAIVPANAPVRVKRLIRAANRIAHKPYVWGGGHGSWVAPGYDCSGSLGYALHAAGVLDRSVTSGDLMSYGKPGRGKWVTIYAHGGHTYMTVAGVRFDTTAFKQTGSRWATDVRDSTGGYVVRHPAGL